MEKVSIYQIVTDILVEQLEKGVIPWKQPWKNYVDGSTNIPTNFKTKKAYRGINPWLLSGGITPFWLGFKQAQAMGGTVRKGEHGRRVVYWKWLSPEQRAAMPDRCPCYPIYSTVFNLSQIDGIELPALIEEEKPIERKIEACEAVLLKTKLLVPVKHNGPRAYYSPSDDYINMPKKDSFEKIEHYYSTLFHEMVHATGADNRLNRGFSNGNHSFGSNDYGKEELIAEMGSAFLCAETGIDQVTLEQSASYLKSWIRQLRGDSKLALQASGAAQKASDYILGKTFEEKEGD